jgi:superfamily II DNA or RNA helicase
VRPLRPYQARAVEEARALVRGGARAVRVVAPTGAGKTRIGVEVCRGALGRGGRVLWLAHRAELLRQARDRLLDEGVPRVGIVAPWARGEEAAEAPVVVASVQTLVARARKGLALPDATVVVLDEAHHYAADDWGRVAEHYAGAVRVGLTATPERADGRPMGDLFAAIVTVAQVSELQRLGVLVPCRVYAPARAQKGLASTPVDAYRQHTPGELAFVFCANVAHAQAVAAEFEAAGVTAGVVHGAMRTSDREAMLARFRARELLALVNVYALTEGVDVPEASACILARGCGSAGTYIQMVGRVLRAAPAKTHATLVDLTGIVHEHGLPDEDRSYALSGRAITRAAGEAAPTVLSCLVCGGCFGAWAEGRLCPLCGAPAPALKAPKVRLAQLVTIESAARGRTLLVELERQADAQGRDARWIAARYRAVIGHWPPATWWQGRRARGGRR